MNKQQWEKHIKELKKIKLKANKVLLKNVLVESIKNKIPEQKFGILFSGGVDSSLIALVAKRFSRNFVCYCVYFSGKNIKDKDIVYAEKAAKELNLKLKKIKLDLDKTEKIIKKVTKLVGADVVKVGVGAVVFAAMQEAKKDNVKFVFSGLGSEEIFAGYERHLVKDINKECWRGLELMYDRDFVRDFRISDYFKIKILVPFLDKEVVKVAMNIPGEQKIKGDVKKYVLRLIANELGLKKEFAFRKKLAAQYGSNVQKAIEKLAKKKGFKFKKDYLSSLNVSQ